jgi:hypothetical protein
VPNDIHPRMDMWALILMSGATAIWIALGSAVAYLVAQGQVASAGERTRTSKGAGPSGT